jgi:hypothetical protein
VSRGQATEDYALWIISMTWNYHIWVFVTLCVILLVQVGIEVLGEKNVKTPSPQYSSWNKVATGVKLTSKLLIAKHFDWTIEIIDSALLNKQKLNC